jgi:CheY-like chemotaxis protein
MNGFLVDAFTNPEEALQNLQSNSKDYYSLVLSDIRMPEMSGIQLARKVNYINPAIKVVLMTAYEIKDDKFSKVTPSVQVDSFIQKPISITDLTNKILDIIG